MRRKDREIKSLDKLYLIMKACEVCRIAFFDTDYPYIVPMNFGVERNQDHIILYFHGAKEGKKITLLKQNPHVSFEMDASGKFQFNETMACQSTISYLSVMGTGILSIVEDEHKKAGLDSIMKQYHPEETTYHYQEQVLKQTTVLKLEINSISGKAK